MKGTGGEHMGRSQQGPGYMRLVLPAAMKRGPIKSKIDDVSIVVRSIDQQPPSVGNPILDSSMVCIQKIIQPQRVTLAPFQEYKTGGGIKNSEDVWIVESYRRPVTRAEHIVHGVDIG